MHNSNSTLCHEDCSLSHGHDGVAKGQKKTTAVHMYHYYTLAVRITVVLVTCHYILPHC